VYIVVGTRMRPISLSPDLVRRASVDGWEQALVGLLAHDGRLSVFQKGAYALVAVATGAQRGVSAPPVFHAGLSVDLVTALNDGVVEGVEAGALDDTADAHKGKEESHEGEV
jgi:hypothetical protein